MPVEAPWAMGWVLRGLDYFHPGPRFFCRWRFIIFCQPALVVIGLVWGNKRSSPIGAVGGRLFLGPVVIIFPGGKNYSTHAPAGPWASVEKGNG